MAEQAERMQDAERLLKRILRADEKAREMTADAAAQRKAAEAKLAEEKAAARASFEKETEEMLSRIRESAQKAAEGRQQSILAGQEQRLAELNAVAASKSAAWIEQICAAVLRG